MVSRLSRSLSFSTAVFIVARLLGYKLESDSLKLYSKDWVVPADGRRSHCLVVFEISLPGHTSLLIQGASYYHIVVHKRGAALLQKLLIQVRRQKAQQRAIEATVSSGGPCKLRGFVGEEND